MFGVAFLGASLTMLIILVDALIRGEVMGKQEEVLGLIVLALAISLMLWLWFDTGYRIDSQFIRFRSGPFRGKIRVSSIREVVVGTTMWSGFRPALARNGVIVKFNQYDDIYFSPDDNEAFVAVLTQINPQIRIGDKAGTAKP